MMTLLPEVCQNLQMEVNLLKTFSTESEPVNELTAEYQYISLKIDIADKLDLFVKQL
jgi:hypothetical protein